MNAPDHDPPQRRATDALTDDDLAELLQGVIADAHGDGDANPHGRAVIAALRELGFTIPTTPEAHP